MKGLIIGVTFNNNSKFKENLVAIKIKESIERTIEECGVELSDVTMSFKEIEGVNSN